MNLEPDHGTRSLSVTERLIIGVAIFACFVRFLFLSNAVTIGDSERMLHSATDGFQGMEFVTTGNWSEKWDIAQGFARNRDILPPVLHLIWAWMIPSSGTTAFALVAILSLGAMLLLTAAAGRIFGREGRLATLLLISLSPLYLIYTVRVIPVMHLVFWFSLAIWFFSARRWSAANWAGGSFALGLMTLSGPEQAWPLLVAIAAGLGFAILIRLFNPAIPPGRKAFEVFGCPALGLVFYLFPILLVQRWATYSGGEYYESFTHLFTGERAVVEAAVPPGTSAHVAAMRRQAAAAAGEVTAPAGQWLRQLFELDPVIWITLTGVAIAALRARHIRPIFRFSLPFVLFLPLLWLVKSALPPGDIAISFLLFEGAALGLCVAFLPERLPTPREWFSLRTEGAPPGHAAQGRPGAHSIRASDPGLGALALFIVSINIGAIYLDSAGPDGSAVMLWIARVLALFAFGATAPVLLRHWSSQKVRVIGVLAALPLALILAHSISTLPFKHALAFAGAIAVSMFLVRGVPVIQGYLHAEPEVSGGEGSDDAPKAPASALFGQGALLWSVFLIAAYALAVFSGQTAVVWLVRVLTMINAALVVIILGAFSRETVGRFSAMAALMPIGAILAHSVALRPIHIVFYVFAILGLALIGIGYAEVRMRFEGLTPDGGPSPDDHAEDPASGSELVPPDLRDKNVLARIGDAARVVHPPSAAPAAGSPLPPAPMTVQARADYPILGSWALFFMVIAVIAQLSLKPRLSHQPVLFFAAWPLLTIGLGGLAALVLGPRLRAWMWVTSVIGMALFMLGAGTVFMARNSGERANVFARHHPQYKRIQGSHLTGSPAIFEEIRNRAGEDLFIIGQPGHLYPIFAYDENPNLYSMIAERIRKEGMENQLPPGRVFMAHLFYESATGQRRALPPAGTPEVPKVYLARDEEGRQYEPRRHPYRGLEIAFPHSRKGGVATRELEFVVPGDPGALGSPTLGFEYQAIAPYVHGRAQLTLTMYHGDEKIGIAMVPIVFDTDDYRMFRGNPKLPLDVAHVRIEAKLSAAPFTPPPFELSMDALRSGRPQVAWPPITCYIRRPFLADFEVPPPSLDGMVSVIHYDNVQHGADTFDNRQAANYFTRNSESATGKGVRWTTQPWDGKVESRFAFIISYAGGPEVELTINDSASIRFTPHPAGGTAHGGGFELEQKPLPSTGGDNHTILYLRVPPGRVEAGKPLTLQMKVPTAGGASSWVGLRAQNDWKEF